MASRGAEKEQGNPEVVSVELPAPDGWVKKFTPKQGSAPKRNEVVFISPSGEEIKNRRQLDQYLRSHPGGPPSSSFDWGTGDTPRRSARISEKVKISPEAEKPTQASKSRERVKKTLELEITKKSGSSGLQKGTKRKKNAKGNDGDEADGEDLEGDGPKDGDVEDAEVSKKGKRRKVFDGDKVEGFPAEGEGPKDVDMDEIEDTHGIVDESTEITEGNAGESAEKLGEIQDAENSKEIIDENAEQGMEREKTLKKTPNDTSISLTPIDSEVVSLVENIGGPKDMHMEEIKGAASSEGNDSIVEDKCFNKKCENIQENVEHEATEKARKGENVEQSKARDAAPTEEVYVSAESTDETEETVEEIIEQPAESLSAIKNGSAIIIEKTIEETIEVVEIHGEIKQECADKPKENESAVEISIGDEFAAKTDENGVEKVEQKQAQPEGSAAELEQETLSGSGGKDYFEQEKEHGQNQIDAEAFRPPPGYEKVIPAAKIDESSSDPIKGTVTLSENGAKQGEAVDSSL